MEGRFFAAPLCLVWAAACSSSPPASDRCSTCTPNLAVDAEVLLQSLRFEQRTFGAGSCEVASACVSAPGERTVLALASAVRNVGDAPLVLDESHFGPSRCGGGPALVDFLRWRVLDGDGSPLREGAGDLHCLADGRARGVDAPLEARFSCERQGLQVGWVDDAHASGGCAFVDVEGLPPGAYELELLVNGSGALQEARLDDNLARVPFSVGGNGCTGVPCGATCCPPGVACTDGVCALPDLIVDEAELFRSLRLDEADFAADDCAVDEGCVVASGERRLLRFSTVVANVGGADLLVGDPGERADAEWSPCHAHYHLSDFATYRLLHRDGSVAAEGHKQAFCLMDTGPWDASGPSQPRYDCDFQGISRGWSDTYGSGLDCQWVDVTGVPEGNYVLEVVVNEARRFPELDYENNTARADVFLPADPNRCVPAEEICWDGKDQDCDGIPDDGCPPLAENDRCDAAWPLDGSGTWTGFIGPGTARPGAGSCGGDGGTLHFSLEVLADEIVHLSTHGSSIDTVLRVEAGGCDEPREIACSATSCGVGQGQFAGELGSGRYDVIVQGRDRSAAGIVKLQVSRSGCSGARPVEAPGQVRGDTTAAGAHHRPSCGRGSGPEDLWFFASCPGTSRLVASTCEETGHDTVLELRRGSCRGRAVACNDDAAGSCRHPTGSRIEAELQGEGLWFLLVDGYFSSDAGPYRLDLDW